MAAVTLVCLAPLVALAEPHGQVNLGANGCNQCHHGGMEPTTTISVGKTQVNPGETIPITVTVTTPNGRTGGFNLTPSAGTLLTPGEGVKLESGEATHSEPKAEDAMGNLVFTVEWTAPMTGTSADFIAWGNSVNDDGSDDGDLAASATATIDICMGTAFFEDADGDGVGGDTMVTACAASPGIVAMGGDCDDTNPAVNPQAAETCNMVDDNCNGQVDDGTGSSWYADMDADGFGDSAAATISCTQPSGTTLDGTDCNDADAAVKPNATEICNGVDDNCNGLADEGLDCTPPPADGGDDGEPLPPEDVDMGGCGCSSGAGVPAMAMLFGLLGLLGSHSRRRRNRNA